MTDAALHCTTSADTHLCRISTSGSIQQTYPGSSSDEPLGRVGVGMALRRLRRCAVLLIPYIVTIYFINHIRIFIISEGDDGLLTDMDSKIGAMPIFEGSALKRIPGHHRMVNATKTTLNQKGKMLSHSSSTNFIEKLRGYNSSWNATHPNCSSVVTPSPCDSLHKPSFGNESQTFQKFYGSGHVFSAHYDYREKIVQVRFFLPNNFSMQHLHSFFTEWSAHTWCH